MNSVIYDFVREDSGIIQSIAIKPKKNVKVDYFDFDNNSIEDFLDYIDFMNYSTYIFVCINTSYRLQKIIDFLNKNTRGTRIKYQQLDDFIKEHNARFEKDINQLLEKEKEKSNDVNLRFENGYKAYLTGMYPDSIPSGVIKHIFLEDISYFNKLDLSVLKSLSINSCIYINNDFEENIEIFAIVKKITDFNKIKKKFLSREEIITSLKDFVSSGIVEFKESLILDYFNLLGMSKLHSLTISDGAIFLDCQKKIKLSNKVGVNKFNLQNIFSILGEKLTTSKELSAVAKVYPIFVAVNASFNAYPVKFITPFNRGKYLAKEMQNSDLANFSWFGFKKGKECFVFNLKNRRLFRVNNLFLDIFEGIIKNEVDNDINQSVLRDVRRLLLENERSFTDIE